MPPPAPTTRPLVGVAALIRHATTTKLLIGKRLSSHGQGCWQFPGGHLEFGEEVSACAERETLEETGLVVRGMKLAGVTNSVFGVEGKHYVTLFVVCETVDEGMEAVAMEPEKCGGWEWMDWETICECVRRHGDESQDWASKRMFQPIRDLVNGQGHSTGFDPSTLFSKCERP